MTDCRRQFSEHTPTLSAFQKLNWEAKNPSGRRCVPPTASWLVNKCPMLLHWRKLISYSQKIWEYVNSSFQL